jgi:hypothetical protein
MKNFCYISQWVLKAVLVLAGFPAQASSVASTQPACIDEFWVISTRHIDEVPCYALPSQLEIHQLDCGKWRRRSTEEFSASHAYPFATIFYVHGNRYTAQDAVERGWMIYRTLCSGNQARLPFRFVLWSWPSDRIPGALEDVRVKAERTDLEGLYLGTVVSRMPPDALVSFHGYSFGTRVISGALHLLAGGALEGRRLAPEFLAPRTPVRAALLAPAFHNTWLLPGALHALALTQVERMFVLYNPLDPVLRRYRLISPTSDPQALGATGLVGLDRLGPLAERVHQYDVSAEAGRTHDERRYLNSSYFPQLRDYLLWRSSS